MKVGDPARNGLKLSMTSDFKENFQIIGQTVCDWNFEVMIDIRTWEDIFHLKLWIFVNICELNNFTVF